MQYTFHYNPEPGIVSDITRLLTIKLAPRSIWEPYFTLIDSYTSDMEYINNFSKEFHVRYTKLLLFSYIMPNRPASYLSTLFIQSVQDDFSAFSFQSFLSYFQNHDQIRQDLLSYYLGDHDYSYINVEPLIRKNHLIPDKLKILLFGFLCDPSTYLRHLVTQMQTFYSQLYDYHIVHSNDFSLTFETFDSILNTWCSSPSLVKESINNPSIYYSCCYSIPHHLFHQFSTVIPWFIFSPNSNFPLNSTLKPTSSISLISLANALSDSSRIIIIQLLQAKQMLTFKELLSYLGCSRSTLTHHLTSLENVKLIQQKQHGAEKYYLCNPDGMDAITVIFNKLTKGETLL